MLLDEGEGVGSDTEDGALGELRDIDRGGALPLDLDPKDPEFKAKKAALLARRAEAMEENRNRIRESRRIRSLKKAGVTESNVEGGLGKKKEEEEEDGEEEDEEEEEFGGGMEEEEGFFGGVGEKRNGEDEGFEGDEGGGFTLEEYEKEREMRRSLAATENKVSRPPFFSPYATE